MIEINQLYSKLNKVIFLNLWIIKLRKIGHIWFIIGQYNNDYIQLFTKKNEIIFYLKKLKRGDLIKIKGLVCKKKNTNELEIDLIKISLINSSKQLPFVIQEEDNINEETKYKYRYLDLRRKKSKELILIKSKFLFEIRKFFYKRNFNEIETPILTSKSLEGAECFKVFSKFKNKYYDLVQSPQLFKQLLMISGFDKYFQIAKCFRNEDSRSNRQIEFSQLDVELSFTTVKKIQKLIETLIKNTLPKIKKDLKISFISLDYDYAIKVYNTDKPDLHNQNNELKFIWINNWPAFSYNDKTKKYESFHHPFTKIKPKFLNLFMKKKIDLKLIKSEGFDLICNGEEILSGGLRIYQHSIQKKVLEILKFTKKEEENLNYFLEALSYGTPPHGGFGLGIERLLSIIFKTKNIKEFFVFPKNIDGTCSITGAPYKEN